MNGYTHCLIDPCSSLAPADFLCRRNTIIGPFCSPAQIYPLARPSLQSMFEILLDSPQIEICIPYTFLRERSWGSGAAGVFIIWLLFVCRLVLMSLPLKPRFLSETLGNELKWYLRECYGFKGDVSSKIPFGFSPQPISIKRSNLWKAIKKGGSVFIAGISSLIPGLLDCLSAFWYVRIPHSAILETENGSH